MAFSFLLPRAPPHLPPLTPTTHRPLLSSSSSSLHSQLHAPFPKAFAATSSTSSFTAVFFPFASHVIASPTVRVGRDPRRSWKTSFSGRPAPPLPAPTTSEAEEPQPSSPPVPSPALPFRGGDLLRGTCRGFWLQLWMAVLSRALLWAIRRPYAPGFPRPAVATWVVLGLWRAVSPDAGELGLVPFGKLVAGVTGKPDIGPVAFSAAVAAVLLLAVGSFLAMDRLAAWAVSEVGRRYLTPDAAIIAFCVWAAWALTGVGRGGAGAEDDGRGAPQWWELVICVVWVQLCVLCLCLPHNLVKYVLDRVAKY